MKPASKKETLLAYLERGIAMVHLDARRPGVSVPAQHQGDPHLRINLSYRYGIPDLLIDDVRVQATLSFRGRPFQCQLPWSAVFGVTSQQSGDAQIWPEDLPDEVMSSLAGEEPRVGAEKLAPPQKPLRPALVAVENDPEAGKPSAPTPIKAAPEARSEEPAGARKPDGEGREPPPGAPPRKGHLRLIR